MAYFTSSKKVRDNMRETAKEVAEEALKTRAGEIEKAMMAYVDESIRLEREQYKIKMQEFTVEFCDIALECSLNSAESLNICSKYQRSELYKIHSIYALNGGSNGFAVRLEELDTMHKSLQEVLHS